MIDHWCGHNTALLRSYDLIWVVVAINIRLLRSQTSSVRT